MPFTAKSVGLRRDEYGYCFYWVEESDSTFRSVELNVDQVALLLKQAADLISQCRIASRT